MEKSINQSYFTSVESKFNVCLKDFQKQTLLVLKEGKDVFLSVCTGGGKSLCYQAFGCVTGESEEKTDRITLIFTPLKSIMQEQVNLILKHEKTP